MVEIRWKKCSNREKMGGWVFFCSVIDMIININIKNMKIYTIDTTVLLSNKFFNKLYEQRSPISTVPKMEFMMVLPFLGTTSLKVKNNLVRSFRQILPFSKLKIVFKTSKRLSACFTFKDKFPKSLMSGVIYKFTCAECNLSYIGCTKRFWEKRLEDYLHISALTGNPLNGLQVYAPMQHVRAGPCILPWSDIRQ